MNKVILIGHLGKDAETKFTQSGKAVTSVSLATTERFGRGEEAKKETTWHNLILWDKEALSQYLVKGSQIAVTGRIQNRSYDNKEGVKVNVAEVVVDHVELLGSKDSRENGASSSAPASRSAAPASRGGRQATPAAPAEDLNDDIPF